MLRGRTSRLGGMLCTGLVVGLAACHSSGKDGKAPVQLGDSGPSTDVDGGDASSSAEAGPTGPDAGEHSGCWESAPRFHVPFQPEGRGFDLAVRGLEVHAAYTVPACMGVGNQVTGHTLGYVQLATSGEVAAPHSIAVVAADHCAKVRDPVLTLSADKAYVEFLSTRENAWEVYRVEPAKPAAAPVLLSDASTQYVSSWLVGHDDVLAWVEEQPAGQGVMARVLSGLVPWIAPAKTLNLTVMTLGALTLGDGSQRAMLGYGSDGDASGLFTLALGKDQQPTGSSMSLGAEPGGTPRMAFELAEKGAAVVYTEGPGAGEELRFLRIDEQGLPTGGEKKLTSGNERARDPAIAAFATGYVIAFRSVLGSDPKRAQLRLAFIDTDGNLAGFRDAFETSAEGGALALRSTVDGRLIVGLAEVDGQGKYQFHVARLTCNG
jgi:hypothetical protein